MDTLRCNNCGWSNSPHARKCEKCKQDLSILPPPSEVSEHSVNDPKPLSCHKCGYSLSSSDLSFCPNCGASPEPTQTKQEKSKDSANDNNKNATSEATFRLKPIDVDKAEAFSFDADAHAAFEFEDGQWFISDRSESGSTFVCATRRISLQRGDVVLIGGRKYLFE